MRKSKFGEKTIVMRIPVSLVSSVRGYLKKHEVIDEMAKRLAEEEETEFSRGYLRGFKDGVIKADEYHLVAQFADDPEALKWALEMVKPGQSDVTRDAIFALLLRGTEAGKYGYCRSASLRGTPVSTMLGIVDSVDNIGGMKLTEKVIDTTS